MSLKRIAIFAAVSLWAALPLPLFAQSLASMVAVDSVASISILNPLGDLLPATVSTGMEAVQAPRTSAAIAVDNSDLDARLSAAISEQVLYKMPRMRLADLAMNLRNIRYRRAGHDPSTGFDCSGFVHYVYNQTFGLDLPYDAPGQYRVADKVSRDQMKTGDLVFFHVGKRITHVGIYLGEGRFIHSPSPGKFVRVDELASSYWAKRFAGARRPQTFS